jgi:hypothetical protein
MEPPSLQLLLDDPAVSAFLQVSNKWRQQAELRKLFTPAYSSLTNVEHTGSRNCQIATIARSFSYRATHKPFARENFQSSHIVYSS